MHRAAGAEAARVPCMRLGANQGKPRITDSKQHKQGLKAATNNVVG
jgi:hypothetical protein